MRGTFSGYGHVIFTSGSDLDPGLEPIEGLGGEVTVSYMIRQI